MEAVDFRENLHKIKNIATVVGISPDTIESHKKFQQKHNLNFYLLSDPEKKVMEQYGAYGDKKMYGKIVKGVIRTTYLINNNGQILKIWKNVRAKGHVEKVITELLQQN